MHRLANLIRDAIGTAPREQALILLVCAVLVATGGGLLGAAAFHAVAAEAGPQAARLLLGAVALAIAGAVWVAGSVRARKRRRLAEVARAQLARDLTAASPLRPGLAIAAATFVAAFLAGRRR